MGSVFFDESPEEVDTILSRYISPETLNWPSTQVAATPAQMTTITPTLFQVNTEVLLNSAECTNKPSDAERKETKQFSMKFFVFSIAILCMRQ
jgi:hypothetical protein